MRGRRGWAWVVYGVSALLVLEALAWAGWRAWRAEREAAIEQAARLALWRMESVAVELIARESRRPAWHYEAYSPGAVAGGTPDEAPGVASLVRSPLLAGAGPMIRLHAVIEPDGGVRSPTAPGGADRERALAELGAAAPLAEWLLTEERLERWQPSLRAALLPAPDADAPRALREMTLMRQSTRAPDAARQLAAASPAREDEEPRDELKASEDPGFESARATVAATLAEALADAEPDRDEGDRWSRPTRLIAAGEAGPIAARWIAIEGEPDPALVLLRRATRPVLGTSPGEPPARVTQVAVVDWDALSARLTGSIVDLLPGARVRAMGEPGSGYPLATLPVALDPGRALPPGSAAGRAAVWTFSIAGLAVLSAILAIGVVLRAALMNADRRARFVTGVTHELRTPLTALRLSTDLAASAAARGDATKAAELAARSQAQATRLERIVESVLAYAKAAGPRGSDAPASPSATVLEEALPGVRAVAEGANVALTVDIDEAGGRAMVRLPAPDLERVLSNLIENAGRYGRAPGLSTSEPAPATVTLRLVDGGRRVAFGVRDGGPGVARRDRRRIFQAFEQGRDASGRGQGVGLGLALSRELARRSGSRVRLAPTPRGAWFELVTPTVEGSGRGR